ncbi:unnamed protein product [Umbelopsis vinacea]
MIRQATHAGSWYSDNCEKLNEELEAYLRRVPATTDDNTPYPIKGTKAIIAPHAGYSYSGATAAFAYRCIDIEPIRRVFILGPSHHIFIDGCAISRATQCETPLGNLTVDTEIVAELRETGIFNHISNAVDEEEHSIEMHLPFIYKVFESKIENIKIIPIIVGSIYADREKMYGTHLARYLADPETLFVVSSDFCHWGLRFDYTYYQAEDSSKSLQLRHSKPSDITTPIHKSISNLDHNGMKLIEELDHDAFTRYLRETKNTICGRHPIGILLAALSKLKESGSQQAHLKFVHYDQSSPCKIARDSSVSYASAYAIISQER